MKVLLISHNCFSDTQNMGKTFKSLFKCFNIDELMQLYFYPSIPSTTTCDNYFRITDMDVIKSIVNRKHCGQIIQSQYKHETNKIYENKQTAYVYKNVNKNNEITKRIRDLFWKFGNWKTEELMNWLESNKPDIIFFALGDAIFSQKIALDIAKTLNIPLVTYVCDNFYYLDGYDKFSMYLKKYMLSSFETTIKNSSTIISISEDMGKDYFNRFNVNYNVIMTGSTQNINMDYRCQKTKNIIAYIGNTSLNRWKSLLEIKGALDKLNSKMNSNWSLVYYGRENKNLLGKIEYGGFLNTNEVESIMKTAKLLIHTECFSDDLFSRIKYSMSTKLADSLAIGNCLFAYGPQNITSIKHLKKYNAAFIATSKDELEKALYVAIYDDTSRDIIMKNARKCAEKCHDSFIESEKMRKIFLDIINNAGI